MAPAQPEVRVVGRGGEEARGPVSEPPRVLLFYEDVASAASLRLFLAAEGFHVTGAQSFLEAAPILTAGRVDLFIVQLPETEWIVNAILTEVRRVRSTLPIVALTATVSSNLRQVLDRLHVVSVPSQGDNREGLLVAIRRALRSSEAATPALGRGQG